MIHRLHAKNYQSLADVSIDFGKITVLVGRNGAGKSAIADVLMFLANSVNHEVGRAIQVREGLSRLIHKPMDTSPGGISIDVELQIAQMRAEYGFTIEQGGPVGFSVSSEWLRILEGAAVPDPSFECEGGVWIQAPAWVGGMHLERRKLDGGVTFGQPTPLSLMLVFGAALDPTVASLAAFLGDFGYAGIFPMQVSAPQRSGVEWPLESRFTNLASVLRRMKREESQWLPDLRTVLQSVVPDIRDIRVQELGEYLLIQLEHMIHGQETWLDLGQESDGTIRLLGMLAAIYQEPPRSMLIIEEPEMMLHPGALAVLADVLKEASERMQIVITTQSPELLSHFAPEQVRVVERVDGATRVGPIDKVQVEAVREHLFTLGELDLVEGLRRASPDDASTEQSSQAEHE